MQNDLKFEAPKILRSYEVATLQDNEWSVAVPDGSDFSVYFTRVDVRSMLSGEASKPWRIGNIGPALTAEELLGALEKVGDMYPVAFARDIVKHLESLVTYGASILNAFAHNWGVDWVRMVLGEAGVAVPELGDPVAQASAATTPTPAAAPAPPSNVVSINDPRWRKWGGGGRGKGGTRGDN